jgi:hypothetical protein
VFRVNDDKPRLKTPHPMAGRIEASIRYAKDARTIPLNPGQRIFSSLRRSLPTARMIAACHCSKDSSTPTS